MTEQFPFGGGGRGAGGAEELNLAPRRLGLQEFAEWIYETYAAPLASRGALPAGGVLLGPEGKSIRATPTDYTFREDFAGEAHRKEWRSFLCAVAYLVKSGQVRPIPAPGAGRRPADNLDRQLAPRSAVSFADGEGALADFFLGRERWQIKSLVDTGEGKPGLLCDLFTTASKKRVPYQRDAFQHLIAVYLVGSRAYI